MKFESNDFTKIRYSALMAATMILIGSLTVHYAIDTRRQAQRTQANNDKLLAEADARLKQVSNEESEVKQKIMIFNQLQERGVVGEEQRLEWIELLKDIRVRRRLLDLEYEIAPQRLFEANTANEYSFFASTMRLQVKLLHEEDLERLLSDLRSQAKALIMVKNCTVSRLPAVSDEHANLLAVCEIDWITLRNTKK
ncbi:MAG TPA: hypothetical protein PLF25_12110 [Accumulibacter sp.]|jgi:hypothetical protein|nr:hypothetical protein [Accumulibacter sp.]